MTNSIPIEGFPEGEEITPAQRQKLFLDEINGACARHGMRLVPVMVPVTGEVFKLEIQVVENG